MHARKQHPDLIITDLGLPVGDDHEVVTQLHRTLPGKRAGFPVRMVSQQ
jgi:CheY-like chemotaxis protein